MEKPTIALLSTHTCSVPLLPYSCLLVDYTCWFLADAICSLLTVYLSMKTVVYQLPDPIAAVFKYEFSSNHLYLYFSSPSCTEPPSEPRDIRVDLGYLQATISWTEPEFLGVPDPLSPDGLVWYVGQLTRDDTGEVVIPESRVNYSTNSTSIVVYLYFTCINYTVTGRAENKAGASMNVSRMFTLVESGECMWCEHTMLVHCGACDHI